VKPQTYFSGALITLAAILVSAIPTQAQILWDSPQNVSNDSNVLTTGTYFDAALLLAGANGGNPLTVNGVAFNIIANGTTDVTDSSGDCSRSWFPRSHRDRCLQYPSHQSSV